MLLSFKMKVSIYIKLSFILLFFVVVVRGAKSDDTSTSNNGLIKPNHPYCDHFTSPMYFRKDLIDQLSNNQYLFKNFKTEVMDEIKLDYYIQYNVISRGLCYYPKETIGENWVVGNIPILNENIEDFIRYDKTVNCYLYYEKFINNDEESLNTLRVNRVGLNHFTTYYNVMRNVFLFNEEYCPYPSADMVSPADKYQQGVNVTQVVYNERVNYINELEALRNKLESTYYFEQGQDEMKVRSYEAELETDFSNLEIVYCGYSSSDKKAQFCSRKDNIHQEERNFCCGQAGRNYVQPVKNEIYKTAIYFGISIASLFMITGSFFSAKIIKEIQMQENIKKSVLNQEKEYQESTKQNLQNAYNKGFDPKKQTYNSYSRNLNGTLRNGNNTMKSANASTLNNSLLSMGNISGSGSGSGYTSNTLQGSTGATLRSHGNLNRYPPNSYTVAHDYESTDDRDLSLKRGMVVQIVKRYEGGWIMAKDIHSSRQGFVPEYCLGNML